VARPEIDFLCLNLANPSRKFHYNIRVYTHNRVKKYQTTFSIMAILPAVFLL
jgi:hypothetical protein